MVGYPKRIVSLNRTCLACISASLLSLKKVLRRLLGIPAVLLIPYPAPHLVPPEIQTVDLRKLPHHDENPCDECCGKEKFLASRARVSSACLSFIKANMRRQKKMNLERHGLFCTAHLIRHEVQGERGMSERLSESVGTCVIREPVLFPWCFGFEKK